MVGRCTRSDCFDVLGEKRCTYIIHGEFVFFFFFWERGALVHRWDIWLFSWMIPSTWHEAQAFLVILGQCLLFLRYSILMVGENPLGIINYGVRSM